MLNLEVIYQLGYVLGGLSLLVFLLGHLGFISPPYLTIAAIISVSLIGILLIKGSRERENNPLRTTLKNLNHFEKFLLSCLVLLILSILLLALTPPTTRDELIHHLAVPRLYIQEGKIFEIPFMGFSYLPQNIELLYLISLALGSDTLPRVLHLAFAILTGLLIYHYLLPQAGRTYSLISLLLYLSTPLVFNLSRTAYIDLASTFYSTLAMIAVLKWKENDKWLIYSALAMGLALGSKYNNLITLFLLNAFVVYVCSKRTGRHLYSLKAGILYLFITIMVLSPWLVRNYLWKGSPFYPFYESVSGAIASDEGFHIAGELPPLVKRRLLYNENAIDLMLLPLRLFWQGEDDSLEKFDGVLNPFYLFFLPLIFIKRGSRDIKYFVLFWGFFFYVAFFTVDLVTRYLLPAIPPLMIMIVWGIKNILESKRFKVIGAAMLILLFLFNVSYAWGLYKKYKPLSYLIGQETRGLYLSRMMPDYEAIKFANLNLPIDARVMFLFTGDRGFYWERDYYYGDRAGIFFKTLIEESSDEEEIKYKIFSLGITHLFIRDSLFEKFATTSLSKDELWLFLRFFNKYMVKLYSHNDFSIYRIK